MRVNGAIDVRILPTPSLVLRDIEAERSGHQGGRNRLRAGARAADARRMARDRRSHLVRPEFALALDQSGRIAWPGAALSIDQDALSIERFALEDGRARLRDEASGSSLVLDQVWFNGDLRSLVGPLKGEGGFFFGGERFGYRLATGRWSDDAIKVRLNIDPSDRLVAVEADGVLRFERNSPRFEGALSIARPAGVVLARGRALASEAWRVSSRVKASPTGALIDQSRGAVRLRRARAQAHRHWSDQIRHRRATRGRDVGASDRSRSHLRPAGRRSPRSSCGPAPLRRSVRRRAGAADSGSPWRSASIRSRWPARHCRSVRGDVATEDGAWNLETVEFRAPGMTQVRASGRMALVGDGATFTGPAVVESSDPKVLLAWLEGRPEPAQGLTGALRVSGDFTLGTQRIAVERFKAEVDRKAISGRLAYGWATPTQPARLDGELKAAELDIDSTIAFSKAALAGTSLDAPGEVSLALDIGVATIGGVEAKAAKAKLSFDAHGLILERVAVADLGGAALDLNGRIDAITTSPRGALTLDVDASRLDGVAAVLTKYAAAVGGHRRHGDAASDPGEAERPVDRRARRHRRGQPGRARRDRKGGRDPPQHQGRCDRRSSATSRRPRSISTAASTARMGRRLLPCIGLDRWVATEKRPASLTRDRQRPASGSAAGGTDRCDEAGGCRQGQPAPRQRGGHFGRSRCQAGGRRRRRVAAPRSGPIGAGHDPDARSSSRAGRSRSKISPGSSPVPACAAAWGWISADRFVSTAGWRRMRSIWRRS